ncbi:MAG: 4Fe-4S dicluster domain-containing protein [Candidatus Omnitrophica bacterium]|nr:4Fe-4S dicluster domain-containing protein [Candidatus Omnitrophota bacterium]
MIEELRSKAKELLKNKQVELIIGYQRAADGVSAKPCFIDKEKDTDLLIWDTYCIYNLSNYLKEYRGRRVGVIAKACDTKSIVVLLHEKQLKRQDLFIIGVECRGAVDERMSGFAQKCKNCLPSGIAICDYLIKDKEEKRMPLEDYDEYEPIRKMEAKAFFERLKFWEKEFKRCIRCYACRQICPMCYCPKCVADQAHPSWFFKATNLAGNFSWNVTRAMHLAGRCIDCGECERACPVGIPLREINKKIEKDIKELFKYQAGVNQEQKSFFACFEKSDPEDWIK